MFRQACAQQGEQLAWQHAKVLEQKIREMKSMRATLTDMARRL
jgi:hypothetical protein